MLALGQGIPHHLIALLLDNNALQSYSELPFPFPSWGPLDSSSSERSHLFSLPVPYTLPLIVEILFYLPILSLLLEFHFSKCHVLVVT